jgi:lipopolysaccharide/colanic/teichoic acid biosynthesis glycosyltransferase
MHLSRRWALLCILEALVVASAMGLGAFAGSGGTLPARTLAVAAGGGSLIVSACVWLAGLHRLRNVSDEGCTARRLLGALALAMSACALAVALLPRPLAQAALAALAAGSAAWLGMRALSGRLAAPPRVFLLGDGQSARYMARELGRAARAEVIGFANLRTPRLPRRVEEAEAQVVVIATDDHRGAATADLLECRVRGLQVALACEASERLLGKVAVDCLRPSDLIFGAGFRPQRLADAARRVASCALAAVALAALWPLGALFAFIAWVCRAGPLLAREQRTGLEGCTFALWVPSTNRAGRLLGTLGLGRLPGLWNVLCGQLALVGPRPLPPDAVQQLAHRIPFFDLRQRVRPGLCSWADVADPLRPEGAPPDPGQSFGYDLFYIRHRSLAMDAAVLLGALGRAIAGT